jgi:hypothetical protein
MPNPVEARSAGREPKQNSVSPLAGKSARKELLVAVARLEKDYFVRRPHSIVAEAKEIVNNALRSSAANRQ